MLTTYKNYFDQKLGSFYTALFASILPLMVFVPFGLPILTHFIALTFLFEIKTRFNLKNLFRANIKAFYLINIFSFICFLSVLTSISPRLSLKNAFSLTYYLNFGFLMYCGAQVTQYKKQIEQGLCVSFILGLFFGFIEAYFEGFIIRKIYDPSILMHKYNKFTSLLCLILPFILLISFENLKIFSKFSHLLSKRDHISKYFIQIFLCFLSIIIIFKFKSDTSKLSIVIDVILISFFLCHFIPLRFKKTFVRFLVCFYFIAPSIGVYVYQRPKIQKVVFETIKKGSMYDRLSIWQYVQNLSLSKGSVPRDLSQKIFGYGLHTSKVNILSPQDRTWILPAKAPNSVAVISSKSQAIPLHPHNFILQIWLELGYLGLLITFILLNTFINYIFRKKSNDLYITAATLSFFNFMTIASIAYSIWQSWWLCAIIIAITLSKLFRNK